MYFFAIALFMQTGCEKTDLPVIIEESDPITDIDGNVYKAAIIGDQHWMVENLNVSHFRNGDPIPEAKTNEEWELAGTEGKPAWCYCNNDPGNASTYGKLYNRYAVNDPRGLCMSSNQSTRVSSYAIHKVQLIIIIQFLNNRIINVCSRL
jgi:hypothetical protein